MSKNLKSFLAIILALCVAGVLFTLGKYYTKTNNEKKCEKARLTYAKLDHDIFISSDSIISIICDDQLTGWKASCGPSPAGWPMAFPFRWEVYCIETSHYYFARLIYHEYVLWMSFDQPYVLVKIPKVNTTSDWKTNESARYNTLWNITREFEMGYNEPDCLNSPQVYDINDHYVHYGDNTFHYSKYVVVHDVNHPW